MGGWIPFFWFICNFLFVLTKRCWPLPLHFLLHLLLLKHLQRSPSVLLDFSGIFYSVNRSVYILAPAASSSCNSAHLPDSDLRVSKPSFMFIFDNCLFTLDGLGFLLRLLNAVGLALKGLNMFTVSGVLKSGD